jgi:hypothetical protein
MFDVFANYEVTDSRLTRNTKYQVCSVRSDKNGYPEFLIYASSQWFWKSAKHFHLFPR